MIFAEHYATPTSGNLGGSFARVNDFKHVFFVRWGKISFAMHHGVTANLKVVLKIFSDDGVCDTFLVDTDAWNIAWNRHTRSTRDFYIQPYSKITGQVNCIKFSFIVHLNGRSIPSEKDYIFMDWPQLQGNPDQPQERQITAEHSTLNHYRTYEVNAHTLQADVDWINHHYESLQLVPKFTKGHPTHPYHPKSYIHHLIDKVIRTKAEQPQRLCTIKVSVDCIDDSNFITHLIHAHEQGVLVQCIVDWRKMTLTNSNNYARLKRSGAELIGVVCSPDHHLIEVEPDMHTKFVIFNDEDCILGSFNITFDRWWANWESGMTFHSKGVCRLLDNIFQSQRGGVIQQYGINPHSHFNLLYTFGGHLMEGGKAYLPHHAIFAEINRARHSIKVSLFLIGDLLGEHHDSVVNALINAKNRGVHVHILFNGHLARQGDVGAERSMAEELSRPLLPAVQRLRDNGVKVGLVYGQHDHPVPYSPIHSKYCVIDERVVIDGSFNWYNTSVFSHDLIVVAANHETAKPYLYEFEEMQRVFRVF
ncbi:MAG: phosphatidylserine/phosphatidylglycerophosphate/cardiolipin synthase family protein [Gammaproteobacteria bacterium]|uniref:phospholipase D-like domain-containing protein n=1 Tax=Pseudomaricurvus alcaniphilus TaxID=1166482 RepID=UPI00140AC115|nr:phospholipase D-like domain-containing protein [Pseudomaricurvus alcaniphilus]MBR9909709.1 phosphatidylserine/phosphatidylglycerophosphate/cardiolipin synthase family protein [Gammaproteobacteria bacterium]NHN38428.1 phosphatidylserine/phosphatidylglycerophosphate/cardiolipin synthase family protein [Pseudomaricurvus alcaniphilus]